MVRGGGVDVTRVNGLVWHTEDAPSSGLCSLDTSGSAPERRGAAAEQGGGETAAAARESHTAV